MLKYAWRHFRRRLLSNLLLILQMSVIQLICAALISSVVSRYDLYAPLRQFLRGEGDYYTLTLGFDPETGDVPDSAGVEQKLRGNARVFCAYDPCASIQVSPEYEQIYLRDPDGERSFEQIGGHTLFFNSMRVITYDDAILRAFQPQLSAGEWIDPDRDYGGRVPVLLTENQFGYELGDTFLYSVDHETTRTAIVVGLLAPFARVLLPAPAGGEALSVHTLCTQYSADFEGKSLLISSDRLFSHIHGQPNGVMFVQYPDGISEADHAANHAWLMRCGAVQSAALPVLRRDSLRYIFGQCLTLLPVVICALILTLTSILSMSALAAKRQLRSYAVYAVCGLPWTHCLRLHAAETLLSASAAFAVTFFVQILFPPLLHSTVLRLGIWQFIGGFLITIFFVFSSVLLPNQLFRGNTLRSILQTKE